MKIREDKPRTLQNILYALKTCWSISKPRVIQAFMFELFDKAIWLFTGIFFLRTIIGSIESNKSYAEISGFVTISLLILYSVSTYMSWYTRKILPVTDTLIYEKLYAKIYRKARNVELRCYEDSSFYNKYTMAIDGAGDKMTLILKHSFAVITGIACVAAAFSVLLSIDKNAFVFLLTPLVGNFIFGRWLNRLLNLRYKGNVKNERVAEYINRIFYLADYAKELRLSNISFLLRRKYDHSVEGAVKVVEKYSIKAIIAAMLKNILVFTVVFEGVMIYAVYHTIVTGSISLADLAIIVSVMNIITWTLMELFNSISELHSKGLFMEYLRCFLEYKEEIPENWDGRQPEAEIHSIEFRNVSFSYQPDKPLLHKLSFTIQGKEHVALVGHNGAGKSTIIKLMFRLYDPTDGEILLNGINIKEYNLQAYRALFAAAFQDYKVFALSVKDNVLMGRQGTDDDVVRALKKSDIYDTVSSLQNGMDTILTREFDDNGAVLSGGQYQKIVVARAFVQNTPIKVFDEPSSALDPIAEYNLYSSIMRDTEDKTLIFISHRLSSVQDADKVYMMENGMVLEEGTHTELMKRGGAYADMYGKQAKNYLASNETEVLV